MFLLLLKFLVYANVGLLIEVWFTGIGSIFRKDHKLTSQTYLWMAPLYGLMGVALEWFRSWSPFPFYVQALVYTLLFYGAEIGYGLLLRKVIGVIPWNYGHGKFTPLGVTNFKYLPWWLVLALVFDPLSHLLHACLRAVSVVGSSYAT